MKTYLILSFILLSCIPIGHGQSDTSVVHSWTLELGYNNFRTHDKNTSPLIYSANNGQLDVQFEKTKTNMIWNVNASVSIGSNHSKRFGQREAVVTSPTSFSGVADSSVYVINPPLSFIHAGLSYSYLRKLNSLKSIFIGGTLSDDFYYSGLGGDTWFLNQLSISPVLRIFLNDNDESRIAAEVCIPVISYLIRKPYAMDPSLPEESYFKAFLKTGSNVSSLNDFQQVNISLQYQHLVREKNSIGLSYRFMWMNYANLTERNLRAYSNNISVSYQF